MTELSSLVDLAAKRFGGAVLVANDEYFAPKETLLDPAPPIFTEDRYTDRGKWMDGWETRRRREPGHDWCVVRLGLPGVVRLLVVDTSHFTGNYPDECSIEGGSLPGYPGVQEVLDPSVEWVEVVPRSPLQPDFRNEFPVKVPYRFTHLRLNIFPDGGVARLRVLGDALTDLDLLGGRSRDVDLAALENGGVVIACSDMFFSHPDNLVGIGIGYDMSDGWETRRRRGPGHDWNIVRLFTSGVVSQVEVDTSNFKGNYPDTCSVEACDAPGASPEDVAGDSVAWWPLLPQTKLQQHLRHRFNVEPGPSATHVRLSIFPDGGVSRLRVWGNIDERGWLEARLRRLNAALPAEAIWSFLRCCGSTEWAREMTARRPFASLPEMQRAADDVWGRLGRDAHIEAFAAHPRIGERQAAPAASWAGQEQSATAAADAGTVAALQHGNETYEQRFGHTFIVSATGKRPEEMLAMLEQRLANDPERELEIAAEEQRKITRLRLERLVAE